MIILKRRDFLPKVEVRFQLNIMLKHIDHAIQSLLTALVNFVCLNRCIIKYFLKYSGLILLSSKVFQPDLLIISQHRISFESPVIILAALF